jgi:hypothetical protein
MIEIKKVRGENKIQPIFMRQHEYEAIIMMGYDPKEFLEKLICHTAKKRRWTWYFEKKASEK